MQPHMWNGSSPEYQVHDSGVTWSQRDPVGEILGLWRIVRAIFAGCLAARSNSVSSDWEDLVRYPNLYKRANRRYEYDETPWGQDFATPCSTHRTSITFENQN